MQAKKKQTGSVVEGMLENKSIEQFKQFIHGKYGVLLTDELVRDILATLDALTREMAG